MKRLKIKEVLNEDASIFTQIATLNVFEWLDSTIGGDLDFEYVLSHSADKWISNLFEKTIAKYEGTPNQIIPKLANIIVNKFEEKWNRLYLALIESLYNPIENYNSEEVETPDISISQATKIVTKNNNDGYGFNSSTKTPIAENEQSTEGLAKDNINHETGTRTRTRHGNIGVTTNQQMITQEIEMRNKFLFYDILMDDVDSVITLGIY